MTASAKSFGERKRRRAVLRGTISAEAHANLGVFAARARAPAGVAALRSAATRGGLCSRRDGSAVSVGTLAARPRAGAGEPRARARRRSVASRGPRAPRCPAHGVQCVRCARRRSRSDANRGSQPTSPGCKIWWGGDVALMQRPAGAGARRTCGPGRVHPSTCAALRTRAPERGWHCRSDAGAPATSCHRVCRAALFAAGRLCRSPSLQRTFLSQAYLPLHPHQRSRKRPIVCKLICLLHFCSCME